jgi:hypothetical protein
MNQIHFLLATAGVLATSGCAGAGRVTALLATRTSLNDR